MTLPTDPKERAALLDDERAFQAKLITDGIAFAERLNLELRAMLDEPVQLGGLASDLTSRLFGAVIHAEVLAASLDQMGVHNALTLIDRMRPDARDRLSVIFSTSPLSPADRIVQ